MTLELGPFRRAIAQLEAGLASARARPNEDIVRDGVIQRFEYVYELAWKMLRRHLEIDNPSRGTVEAMSFPTLIRTGGEQGLIRSGWDDWSRYRDARGTTSHTYDQEKAEQVYRIVPEFLDEVRYLLDRLEARHGRNA